MKDSPSFFLSGKTALIMTTYPSERNSDSGSPSTSNPSLAARKQRRRLQYAGIALVIISYIGGMIWWTYASMNIEPTRDSGFSIPSKPAPSTAVEVEVPASSARDTAKVILDTAKVILV